VEFVLIAIGCVVVTVVGVVYGDPAVIRRLRKAKTFAIGELAEGQRGRVIGEAFPLDETLTAPLTGRPCVYYLAIVEERTPTDKSPKPFVEEIRSVPFVLTDGTGRAVVDPRGAKMAIDFDSRTTSGMFDDATKIEAGFLERHHRASRGALFNKGLVYMEAIIHVGERIAVLGEGVREPDPDVPPTAEYRGEQPTRLRMTGTRRAPLVISDSRLATQPKP
jgi:hypothetical protein